VAALRITNSPPTVGFALRLDVLVRPNPSDAPRDRTSTCAYTRAAQATPIGSLCAVTGVEVVSRL
jgi:hypothetical protein